MRTKQEVDAEIANLVRDFLIKSIGISEEELFLRLSGLVREEFTEDYTFDVNYLGYVKSSSTEDARWQAWVNGTWEIED